MSSIYQIKFFKSSLKLEDDYDQLSDIDKEKISDINSEAFFDFYLPDYNILIEYDGRQHFESVDLFGGQEGFERRKLNDEIKNKYCIKNGIHLLRISHLEDVDSKLNDFLVKHCI
jgi:very-short-patch-repair endonuclease